MQPAHGDATHAVVLLPAIAGVNAYVASRAAQLGRAGYLVVVVDYFSRAATHAGPVHARAHRCGRGGRRRPPRARRHPACARLARPAAASTAQRAGVLGFCIGGSYAVLAASEAARSRLRGRVLRAAALRTDRRAKPLDPIGVAAGPAGAPAGPLRRDGPADQRRRTSPTSRRSCAKPSATTRSMPMRARRTRSTNGSGPPSSVRSPPPRPGTRSLRLPRLAPARTPVRTDTFLSTPTRRLHS